MKLPTRQTLKEQILLALYAALMFALQIAMAQLPNIEPVTLFVILLTTVYGWKSLISVYVFVLLEGLFWGFGEWWIGYLYVWAILVVIVMCLRRHGNVVLWTVVAGFYGLCFGLLCAPAHFLVGGIGGGLAWIISGLPYDIIHGIGNIAMVLILFVPLQKLLLKLVREQ